MSAGIISQCKHGVAAMNLGTTILATGALLFTLSACVDNGPVGPPGPPGNANVFSATFNFRANDLVVNGPVASVQYDVPAITPGVVDDGAVLAFFQEQGTWTAMPYTFAEESPDLPAVDYTITLGYGFDDRFLELFYESSTDAVDLTTQPDRLIKVVIIDGFPLGKTGIDLRDYEAVKRYFDLEE